MEFSVMQLRRCRVRMLTGKMNLAKLRRRI
jgi:hypothetical protein